MLDVETTSGDPPQLVSIEAVLYKVENDHFLRPVAETAAVVKPRKGYPVLQHMHDVRYHGVTAEMMQDYGDDAAEALGEMLRMVRRGCGKASLTDSDGPVLIIVAHGAQGMIANLMAAARADESLHPYWEELEALCQRTDDTLPLCVRELKPLPRCTLEWAVKALGSPLPKNRAWAVALLYARLHHFTIIDES